MVSRALRWIASGVGWLCLVVLAGLLLLLGGAYLRATVFYSPVADRVAEKEAYLEGLGAADAGAPSFVVIYFDDLGYGDLSSYGSRLIETPHIDRAAAEGMRFTQFYSTSPVCTPSRAALLTGRYPVRSHTHQHVFFSEAHPAALIRRMLGAVNELPRDEVLLPEILGRAGYATGMVGKWHLGDRPGHRPNDFGFERFYGVMFSNDMQPLHVYRDREIEIHDDTDRQRFGSFRDADTVVEKRGTDQSQLTRRYTEEAIGFLERHRDEPFFLYLAHTFPHVPHFASPEHAGESEAGVYGDVVEDLDRSTGAILAALDRLGLSERTLVVITSDNGADYNGAVGPLRGRKGETYEGGQRVPGVFRWPGRIPAGVVTDAISMQIDLFPTFLGLAGLAPPGDRIIDGVDLVPLLEGRSQRARERLFYFPVLGARPDAVRDERFKYLRESGDAGRSKPQLTRLDLDEESHNLAARFPEETERLRAALDAMDTEVEANPRGWK